MKAREFECSKGKGKAATVERFTAKSEEDLQKIDIFLSFGWSVKEVTKAV